MDLVFHKWFIAENWKEIVGKNHVVLKLLEKELHLKFEVGKVIQMFEARL